jgi:hypothetical protein
MLVCSEDHEHVWRAIHEGDPEALAMELEEGGLYWLPNERLPDLLLQLFDQYQLLTLSELEPEMLSVAQRHQAETIKLLSLETWSRAVR